MSNLESVFYYLICYWDDFEIPIRLMQVNKFWRDYCRTEPVKNRIKELMPTAAWVTLKDKKIKDVYWYPEKLRLFKNSYHPIIFWGNNSVKKISLGYYMNKYIIGTLNYDKVLTLSDNTLNTSFINQHQGNIDDFVIVKEGLVLLLTNKELVAELFSISKVDKIWNCQNQLLYYQNNFIMSGYHSLGKLDNPEKIIGWQENLYVLAEGKLYMWLDDSFVCINKLNNIVDLIEGYFFTKDQQLYSYNLVDFSLVHLPKKLKIINPMNIALSGKNLIFYTA